MLAVQIGYPLSQSASAMNLGRFPESQCKTWNVIAFLAQLSILRTQFQLRQHKDCKDERMRISCYRLQLACLKSPHLRVTSG